MKCSANMVGHYHSSWVFHSSVCNSGFPPHGRAKGGLERSDCEPRTPAVGPEAGRVQGPTAARQAQATPLGTALPFGILAARGPGPNQVPDSETVKSSWVRSAPVQGLQQRAQGRASGEAALRFRRPQLKTNKASRSSLSLVGKTVILLNREGGRR